jgi:catechol 2,3-dioxygenase-like lactoylglutathione lyase family enzyme
LTHLASKLEAIVVYAESVKKSLEFYRRLGFTVEEIRPDYGAIDLGGLSLKVHEERTETLDELRVAAAIRPRGASLFLYSRVPDIDLWYQQHADATPYEAPRDRPWGRREVLVVDPDGFQLMFYS